MHTNSCRRPDHFSPGAPFLSAAPGPRRYQRDFVWDAKTCSGFVRTVYKGLETPPLTFHRQVCGPRRTHMARRVRRAACLVRVAYRKLCTSAPCCLYAACEQPLTRLTRNGTAQA